MQRPKLEGADRNTTAARQGARNSALAAWAMRWGRPFTRLQHPRDLHGTAVSDIIPVVAFVLCTLGPLMLPSARIAAGALDARATPAEWRQWQPEKEPAESVLHRSRVSLWATEITVQEAVSRLSAQSPVRLSAAGGLRDLRFSIFAERATLAGLMAALMHAVDGYWATPREVRRHPPEYRLVVGEPSVEGASLAELASEALHRQWQKGVRTRASAWRPVREKRMALYCEALSLAKAELLARYEEDNPWVCARLLDPGRRPMLRLLCALSEAQREELLDSGEVTFRLSECSDDFRTHMAEWAKGRWGRAGWGMRSPDPDRIARFPDPAARWRHATVSFTWGSDDDLQVYLNVPDVGRFSTSLISSGYGHPPADALRRLVQLGVYEDSPQMRDKIQRAEQAGSPAEEQDRRDEYLGGLGELEPNRTDPRLACELGLLGSEEELSVPRVLEQAARRCDLVVVGSALPSDFWEVRGALSNEDFVEDDTLGGWLERIRDHLGHVWWWNFYGRYLVARHEGQLWVEASGLPPGTVEEWKELTKPGNRVALSELASRLGELNIHQVQQLENTVAPLMEIPVYGIHFYGRLGEAHREELMSEDGLAYRGLGPELQRQITNMARATRSWVSASDLANTRVRAFTRELSTGKRALTAVVEYGFQDAPKDRDVFFTAPFEIVF